MTRSIFASSFALLASLALVGVPAMPAVAGDRTSAPESTRSLYLELIRQARADGRPRAAVAFLDDFDKQYPDDVEAKILRINCMLDLGETSDAARIAQSLPDNQRARNLGSEAARGHVQAALGDWTSAAGHYEAAIDARPADAYLRNALGYAQVRAGNAQAGIESLLAANELAPSSSVIRNNLALALFVGGDSSAARELLDEVTDEAHRAELDTQIRAEAARIAQALVEATTTLAIEGDDA